MATGLYIAMDFKPTSGSGIAEQTHQMAKHMTEMGESVTVLTPSLPADTEFDRSCNYPIVRFDARRQEQGVWSRILRTDTLFRSIISNASQVNADYMILDRWSPICGLMVTLAARILQRPFFLIVHGSEFYKTVPFKTSRVITSRAALKIICISEYTRNLAQNAGLPPDKLVTVLHGFDAREIDEYRDRKSARRFPNLNSAFLAESPTILTVCRLTRRKGIDKVIDAMPLVSEKVPKARYVIVGDGGDASRLKRLAEASPVSDSITFLGSLAGDEKFECYNRCDIFVMNSREVPGGGVESFGIVFLEANSFGKPVIGTNIGGVPEAIIHEETGLLVEDPNNIEEIANSIVLLLNNPSESRRLGNNGKMRIENGLTWRKSASKLLTVIHNSIYDRKECSH